MINHTETLEGPIAHKPHPAGFDCPVRLHTIVKSSNRGAVRVVYHDQNHKLPLPERRGGHLVYALPGGGTWCPWEGV